MANEIKVTSALDYTNGDLGRLNVPSRTQQITQNTAAPARAGGTQTIGFAAHEALVVTDITTLGWACCGKKHSEKSRSIRVCCVLDGEMQFEM